MRDDFSEMIFREMEIPTVSKNNNIIKAGEVEFRGKCKFVTEEESHNGVKIILRKNEKDDVQEIKFVCSCGQAKVIQLNYAD